MITKYLAVAKESTDRITFDVHEVNEEGLMSPILWCRQGEFRLIPKAVIENIIASAEIYAKLDSGKTTNPQLQIMWSQGIPISNLAGRALLGE